MRTRAQSVGDADRDIRQYLIRVAAALGDALADAFTALYVRGSLATGSFYRERSDIDLLAVVNRKLLPQERQMLARLLATLAASRPIDGDLKVAVLQERYARAFEDPLPLELRFGPDREKERIAVELLELRQRGVVLVGPAAQAMFGPVPWYAYISALHEDFDWAGARITVRPVYAVLNACRVLQGATSREMSVPNKAEAAGWALENVPAEHRSTINDALHVYRGTKSVEDVIFFEAAIRAFRSYVFERVRGAFERAKDTGEQA